MLNLPLSCYLFVTILARTLGVAVLPASQHFTKKLPTAIYLLTGVLSYYAMSTYVAYLDFSLIYIMIAGSCLCINLLWGVVNGNTKLKPVTVVGTGLVLAGGVLSLIL
ncbi:MULTISPECIES: hypothetical protein [Enterobacteriaceae]|jgi:multidrug transporter EmrE-like cation transporter|uniref:hypothetical protein n=1 Tax=Enterobacteriaceae TaxID=543 RepID=UPI001F4717AE|nr:hypothetical protein [Lelliottia sp. WAP21]